MIYDTFLNQGKRISFIINVEISLQDNLKGFQHLITYSSKNIKSTKCRSLINVK